MEINYVCKHWFFEELKIFEIFTQWKLFENKFKCSYSYKSCLKYDFKIQLFVNDFENLKLLLCQSFLYVKDPDT